MERLMQANPGHWARYCQGSPTHQRLQRHYSYSDRIRYYWTEPAARDAVTRLLAAFGASPVPQTLISQYLGAAWPEVMTSRTAPTAPALLRAAVARALTPYFIASYENLAE
jgi:D-tagatose-1,6-bisphosphate aldolase subunit GatZ/KbaZ